MEIAKLRTTQKNNFLDKLSKMSLFFFVFFLIEVVSYHTIVCKLEQINAALESRKL